MDDTQKLKLPISLISTLTEDVLLDEQGKVISTSQGGPGLFIGNALLGEGVPFRLIEGDRLKVEILVTPRGEFGKIPTKPREMAIDADLLNGWAIISTVVGEWKLPEEGRLSGCLFVDLQGFVRDGTNFGGKKVWSLDDSIARQIFCIKGTAEETKYLPPSVLEDQKQRLLLITNGKNGVDMYFRGDHHHYQVKEEVVGLKNTIGAGDTLLGNFAAQLFKGNSPDQALQTAIGNTSIFLKQKLSTNAKKCSI